MHGHLDFAPRLPEGSQNPIALRPSWFGPFFSKLASKAEPYSSFRNLYCNDMHMEEGSLSSIIGLFSLHKSNMHQKQRKGGVWKRPW